MCIHAMLMFGIELKQILFMILFLLYTKHNIISVKPLVKNDPYNKRGKLHIEK